MITDFEDLIKNKEKFNRLKQIISTKGGRVIILVHPFFRYGDWPYTESYKHKIKRLLEIAKFPIFILEESIPTGNLTREILLKDINTERAEIVIVPTISRFPVPDISLSVFLGEQFDVYLNETEAEAGEDKIYAAAKRFVAETLVDLGVTQVFLGGEMGKAVERQKLHPKHCVNGTKKFIERYSKIKIIIMEKALEL